MEETTYVSPAGNEQVVSTPIEAYRLKNRGWRPKFSEGGILPDLSVVNDTSSDDVLPKPPRTKKPKQPPKPAA